MMLESKGLNTVQLFVIDNNQNDSCRRYPPIVVMCYTSLYAFVSENCSPTIIAPFSRKIKTHSVCVTDNVQTFIVCIFILGSQ